ncbi:MAG: ABC transporter substrate-binding protein [bacterium]|jgi:branched-chain amino acid transport system substrate-binding protein
MLRGRRKIYRLGILGVVLLMLVSAVAGCGPRETPGKALSPIKVGLLVPYTGVFASNGIDITRGLELYLDEVGWKAGGRDLELIKEDTEMNGQVGLQKARRLVENEKVDILTGIVSSTVAYALRDYVVSNKVPLVLANAGATDLTRERRDKYIFRVSFANGQFEYPMGKYVYDKLGYRRLVVMAPDYAAGREKADGFMAGFKEAGGEVIQEIYPKLGTTDYGPYLAQVNLDTDGVWAHFSAADSIRFVNQYAEYGLKEKLPLLTSGDCVDESSLPSQGDTALGIISALHYSVVLDTPENRKFVANYQNKYGVEPNMFAEQGYVAGHVIVAALDATGGDVSDDEKLLTAIRQVEFTAPRGPFRFHPITQNVIFNTYIRCVEKKDGKLVNTVLETIPDIADNWTP